MLPDFDDKFAGTPLAYMSKHKPFSAFCFPQIDLTLAYRGSVRSPSETVRYAVMVAYEKVGKRTVPFDMVVPVLYANNIPLNLAHVIWPMCKLLTYGDPEDDFYTTSAESQQDKDMMFECVCRNMFAKQQSYRLLREKFRLLVDVIGNSSVRCFYGHQYNTFDPVSECNGNLLAKASLIGGCRGIRRVIFTHGHEYSVSMHLGDYIYGRDFYINPYNFL